MQDAPLSRDRSGGFEVGVDFAVDSVTLRVRGEVDTLTAPALRAVLSALVEQSLDELVLDLADLEFMDASGLGVMADISGRLSTSGRTLTVRSAPPMTLRILEITRMDEIVRLESRLVQTTVLDAEPSEIDQPASAKQLPTNLGADLRRVTAQPDNTVIDAALRLVAVLAGATVGGADGASVTLERNGRMTTVASSNDTVLRMDGHQYATGEGPCLAAAAQGHRFHSESLAEETRWPAFVPRAMDEGIASILSTPLMTAERSIGALNIYSNSERAFGPDQQDLATLFASQASGILVDAGAGVTEDQMAERIADALLARDVIAQAQGMLMLRQRLTKHHAATALYRAARAAETTVREHATAIVASAQIDNGSET
jgi:anti-anti-sigma factor